MKFCVADLVYEWARGVPFSALASTSDVQEGVYSLISVDSSSASIILCSNFSRLDC